MFRVLEKVLEGSGKVMFKFVSFRAKVERLVILVRNWGFFCLSFFKAGGVFGSRRRTGIFFRWDGFFLNLESVYRIFVLEF